MLTLRPVRSNSLLCGFVGGLPVADQLAEHRADLGESGRGILVGSGPHGDSASFVGHPHAAVDHADAGETDLLEAPDPFRMAFCGDHVPGEGVIGEGPGKRVDRGGDVGVGEGTYDGDVFVVCRVHRIILPAGNVWAGRG